MMWTSEQREAINILNTNVTVSASAGAGKTAVLVERLLKRILIDKVSVDQIVALTFTDAAASEMKNRLMKALLTKQAEHPNDDYIMEQITLLPDANITTIHSFCLSLLKDYYYVLNLNPSALSNIISDSDQLALKNEVFDTVLENYDQRKISLLLTHLSSSPLRLDNLSNLIETIATKASSTTDAEAFIVHSVSAYQSYQSLNDLPDVFLHLFYDDLKDHLNQIKNTVINALSFVDNLDESVNAYDQSLWLETLYSEIKTLHTYLDAHNYSAFRASFKELVKLENKTISKQPEYTALRSTLYEHFDTLARHLFSEEELLEQIRTLEEPLTILRDLTLLYYNYYQAAIKKQNKITFNDMETLTYQLLQADDQAVAKSLRLLISDILVDEFQDTNDLQNAIIELLGNGHNIFRVGDVKQSIYRFRGAKPQLMQTLMNEPPSATHKQIYLSNNFRSKHAIVDYNNHLFNQMMNIDGFNSSYNSYDSVTVGTEGQKHDSYPVELHLINKKSEDLSEDHLDLNNAQLKAAYIASQIIELKNIDSNLQWKDFTILVNAHSMKLPLKRAFDDANIPYFIALSDGLYASEGVSLTLAYLQLVYDPSDKLALMSVLTMLYDVSENDIVKHYLKDQDLFMAAKQLVPTLMDTIYKLHYQQDSLSITQMVDEIMLINDFYEQKLSKQNRTNFDVFYNLVLEYDQKHVGLYNFLKISRLNEDAKAQEGSSISNEDNVVNVMTIHTSKGLQFKNVFLMSKSTYRDNDLTSKFSLHPTLGLAIKSSFEDSRLEFDNLIYRMIKRVNHQEAIEEDMRLLYVALTRAQDKLYIVDTISIKEDEEPSYITLSKDEVLRSSFTKWMHATSYYDPSRHLYVEIVQDFNLEQQIKATQLAQPIVKAEVIEHIEKPSYKTTVYPLDLLSDYQATDYGTHVHHLLEIMEGNQWTLEDLQEHSNLPQSSLEKLVRLSHDPFFIEQFNQKTVYKEMPYLYQEGSRVKQGYIDMFAYDNETLTIIDFKTDHLDDASEFISRYQEQIDGYKNAMKHAYPHLEIKAYIYSLNLEQFIGL